jgi:hypothetical protein
MERLREVDLESIFECVGNPNPASSIECAPLFGIWVEEDLSNLNVASLFEVFIKDRQLLLSRLIY